jgi:hypothetical protein
MSTRSREPDGVVSSRPQIDAAQIDATNDTEWRAWRAKNRAEEVRGAARRMTILKWVSMALLFGSALLSTPLAPYQRGISFAVALAAITLMIGAYQARRYVFAAVFAAMVLLYNPLFPTFTLSDGWQRLLVLASITPFLASVVLQRTVAPVPARVQHAS